MSIVKKSLLWLWLLTKRLYKKPTFLIILVLIPLLVLSYSMVAREDSGVLHIALASHESDSPIANQVIDKLMESRLISFYRCDTPEQAKHLVEAGKSDAAWIFLDNLEHRMVQFVHKPQYKNAFIQIIERKSSVPMMLTREMLSGAVFACYSPQFYLQYVRAECPELDTVTDEELMTYYDSFSLNNNLFEFALMDGAPAEDMLENSDYLVSPVRGMLSVVVVLCGLAGAMYEMQDARRKTFGWVPQQRRPLVNFACMNLCVAHMAIAMVVALALFGVTVHWLRETIVLILYIFCVSAFCMMIGRLCGNLQLLGMWTPIFVVIMMVICPVFFDLGIFYPFQLLLPPTYYINAIYSNYFLLRMPIFASVCLLITYTIGKILSFDRIFFIFIYMGLDGLERFITNSML